MTNDSKISRRHDFDYPSLSRRDLMSLSTLNKNDFPLRNIKNRITSTRDWSLNLYNLDIEKAMPNRQSIYTHKIDYINKVDDIDKARAVKNIMSRPSYSLMNRDIEKAYPRKQYRFTRQTNPLEPVYDFPKEVEPGPFEIPKFIRNTLDISDIDKARPKKSQVSVPAIRSENNIVEKSKPRKPYERKVFHDNFSYADVYKKKANKFNRETNPIWPDYGNYGGDIDKSHPQFASNPYRLPGTLSCDDIRGTQPGTKNKSNLINTRHLAYSCEDIIGACQGSYKKGLTSKRMTNPLNPLYQYLGREEMKNESSQFSNQYPRHRPLAGSQSMSDMITKNYFSIINSKKGDSKEQNISFNVNKDIAEQKQRTPALIENRRYSSINSTGNDKAIETNERYEKAKAVNWNELPYYEEKPVFESELYKRPNPFYPFRHHKELILTKTKPHTMNRKYGAYYNNNYFNSSLNKSHDVNNESFSNNTNSKKLDSKLMNPLTYEEQLSSFIKENSYYNR